MHQLQLQLQQRLSQQRARNEQNVAEFRPVSDYGSAKTQSIAAPAPFSRYSAPPTAGGPAVRPTDMTTPPSQQAPVSMASSLSSAATKPGQSLPAAAAHGQAGVSAKSGGGGSNVPAAMSVTVVGRSSSPATSPYVRSASLHCLIRRSPVVNTLVLRLRWPSTWHGRPLFSAYCRHKQGIYVLISCVFELRNVTGALHVYCVHCTAVCLVHHIYYLLTLF